MVDAGGPEPMRTSFSWTEKEKAQRHRDEAREDGGRDSVRQTQPRNARDAAATRIWKRQDGPSPRVSGGDMAMLTPRWPTSGPQRCERIFFCC